MNLSFGLNFIRGLTTICKEGINCESHGLRPASCIIEDADMIESVTVVEQISERRCFYYKGNYHLEGTYGYDNNILWVDFGCQAIFNVCYSVNSTAPPSEKSTISTISISVEKSLKTTISTTVAESSEETTSKFYSVFRTSSTMVYSYSSNETTIGIVTKELESRGDKQPKTSEGPTVEIVVPLCLLGIFVVVLGVILWKKRQTRKQESYKYSSSTAGKLKHQISNTKTNFYETPIVPGLALEKGSVTFCKSIHYPSNTQDQKESEVDSNTILDSRTVEIPGILAVDVQDPYIYSSIDENCIAVQSLPDNEYNVINTNCSRIGQDNNYDTLQIVHIGEQTDGNDNYSITERGSGEMNSNKEYNRIKFTK